MIQSSARSSASVHYGGSDSQLNNDGIQIRRLNINKVCASEENEEQSSSLLAVVFNYNYQEALLLHHTIYMQRLRQANSSKFNMK